MRGEFCINDEGKDKDGYVLIERDIGVLLGKNYKYGCFHLKTDEIYNLINCLQKYCKKMKLKENPLSISFDEYTSMRNELIEKEQYEEVIALDKKYKAYSKVLK